MNEIVKNQISSYLKNEVVEKAKEEAAKKAREELLLQEVKDLVNDIETLLSESTVNECKNGKAYFKFEYADGLADQIFIRLNSDDYFESTRLHLLVEELERREYYNPHWSRNLTDKWFEFEFKI